MSDEKPVTVRELLQDIDAARARMSAHNMNKQLLARCAVGLIELATRASARELTQEVPLES